MTAKTSLLDLAPMPRLLASLRGPGLFRAAHGPIVLARAPGRLDVMGGIADYTGSLVCEMPLAVAAGAAVQRRTDGLMVCGSAQEKRRAGVEFGRLPHQSADEVRDMLRGERAWARYVVGCAWWLVQRGLVRPVEGLGVSIAIDSDVPLGGGVSSSAAIEVATMTALCGLLGVKLAPLELAAACQAVENHVAGAPCGVMDQVTSCLGREGSMIEILCQPDPETKLPARVLGQVQVPKGFAFVGLHSGVRHEVSGDPYTDTRVAAFMAQRILSLPPYLSMDQGHLGNIDPVQFGATLCLALPVQMTGREFLRRYKTTNDPVTRVAPGQTYHVRAAAMHHVWEMTRVRRFVALLKADGPGLEERMVQAGLLMYNSHASYGNCANLGHPLTDKLVEMIRGLGPASRTGCYGAKITGGGSGGTVAILIRDDPATRRRVQALRRRYEKNTGRKTMYFDGTGPGAVELGTATHRIADCGLRIAD